MPLGSDAVPETVTLTYANREHAVGMQTSTRPITRLKIERDSFWLPISRSSLRCRVAFSENVGMAPHAQRVQVHRRSLAEARMQTNKAQNLYRGLLRSKSMSVRPTLVLRLL